jgi:hypothetical protein
LPRLPALGVGAALVLGAALLLKAGLLEIARSGLADWQRPPTSSADAVCAGLWVNNARNDMALRCYLKTDVMRLCAPEERVHLAWLVRRYGAHEKAYEQALLGTIARLRGRATVELAKGEDPAAAYGRAVAEAARPLQNAEFRRAAEIEILLDREVMALFGAVVRVGLLTRADLGGPIPEAIERAFKPGEGVALPGFHPCRLGA